MTVIAAVAVAPILAAIAIDDLRHHRIRNHHVLALAAVTAGVVLGAALDGDGTVIGRAALGAALGAAPLATAWITRPAHVGGGDVKLAAALGALVGTTSPWLAGPRSHSVAVLCRGHPQSGRPAGTRADRLGDLGSEGICVCVTRGG